MKLKLNIKDAISFLRRVLWCLFKEIISLIYKENCVNCNKPLFPSGFSPCLKNENFLCNSCVKDVEILSPFAHSKIEGVQIFSACFYDGIIKNLIHKLKFQHNLSVSRVLGNILFKFYLKITDTAGSFQDACKTPEKIIVVPIPTNKKNILIRGYNNVFEISRVFASLAGFRVLNNLLIKIKNTKPQFELNKKTRESNVKGCFGVNLNNYNGETILLIDDIITTGNTLKEAILTLKNSGVKNIFCITLSKGKN